MPDSRKISELIQGAWDGQTAHLFASSIPKGKEVAVALHEVGEHASMKQMLGQEQYQRLPERARALLEAGDPTALEALSRIPQDTPLEDRPSELLAYLIEAGSARAEQASPGVHRWLADTMAAIRAWWSTTGLNAQLARHGLGIELAPQDIVALAEWAVKWQGRQGAVLDGARNNARSKKMSVEAVQSGENSFETAENSLQKVGHLRRLHYIGTRRNIAFAKYDIDGETGELIGVSGKTNRLGMVGIPEVRIFKTIATGDNERMFDSELKILEYLGNRFSQESSGIVHLFSELPPCPSCRNVIVQFQQVFKNIRVHVTHGPDRDYE